MYKYFCSIFIFTTSLVTLYGCGVQDLTVPAYPLSAETVTMALQKAELPWKIVEAETLPKGQVVYTLYHQNDKLVAFIASSMQGEQRMLDISCMPYDANSSLTHPLPEEEWKQVIIAATLLYGEFENELQIYDCFTNDFENKNTTTVPQEPFVDGKLVNKVTSTWKKA